MTTSANPIYIVTGASGGIGAAIVSALLDRGLTVVGACRHPEQMPEHPRLRRLRLDLSSFDDVRCAAAELSGEPIAAIINNAGIMPVRSTTMTADGYERTFEVNYLSTKLFTELLLPQVVDGGAVVFTSSVARHFPRTVTRAAERAASGSNPWTRFVNYGRSKLMLTHLAAEMSAQVADRHIRVNCSDPGVVDTGLITLGYKVVDSLANVLFRPFISTPQQGASAALRALDSPLTATIFSQKHQHTIKPVK